MMVARVAVDVRLYFDVAVDSEQQTAIKKAAYDELERFIDEDRIRVQNLRFPNLYPTDAWHTVSPEDFQICQICAANEANKDTRFTL